VRQRDGLLLCAGVVNGAEKGHASVGLVKSGLSVNPLRSNRFTDKDFVTEGCRLLRCCMQALDHRQLIQ